MIHFICFFICTFPFLVNAIDLNPQSSSEAPEPVIVNSGEAEYNGREVSLRGEVEVQHPLGTISANQLTFESSSDQQNKKNKFGNLKISKNVRLNLAQGGILTCQEARINFATMQGICCGNTDFPDVIYLSTLQNDSKQRIELRSQEMFFEMLRVPDTSQLQVKQINANKNIRILYQGDYQATGERATFSCLSNEPQFASSGILHLSVDDNLEHCEVKNLNGDHLFAWSIQLDTAKRLLTLSKPFGTLNFQSESKPLQTLKFRSQNLLWDDSQNILTLKGDVNVSYNDVLHLHSETELVIKQAVENGKKTLRSIEVPQKVHISYRDSEKDEEHKIFSPGCFMIDHEQHRIILEGTETGQVAIEDVMGDMFADRVKLDYDWEKQFELQKIVLNGNVRLFNRFDGHREESSSILHYFLADYVEYFPNKREMVLVSREGNRVLFFDKVNNIQMSAPSLKIKRDSTTNKDLIQGIGDVRFIFIETELEQIKQRFRIGDVAQGSENGKREK